MKINSILKKQIEEEFPFIADWRGNLIQEGDSLTIKKADANLLSLVPYDNKWYYNGQETIVRIFFKKEFKWDFFSVSQNTENARYQGNNVPQCGESILDCIVRNAIENPEYILVSLYDTDSYTESTLYKVNKTLINAEIEKALKSAKKQLLNMLNAVSE